MAYDPKYQPTPPEEYNKPQAILDSGRLLFNAKEDSILMFSSKAISLSSVSSVNIDTGKFIVNSDRIDLGLDAEEPLLRGNKTVNLLSELLNTLESVATNLQQTVSTPPNSPLPLLQISGAELKATVRKLKRQLEDLKSNQNYTL
jgi:hypothetical protein